jgi:hypothetical protein
LQERHLQNMVLVKSTQHANTAGHISLRKTIIEENSQEQSH